MCKKRFHSHELVDCGISKIFEVQPDDSLKSFASNFHFEERKCLLEVKMLLENHCDALIVKTHNCAAKIFIIFADVGKVDACDVLLSHPAFVKNIFFESLKVEVLVEIRPYCFCKFALISELWIL